MPWTNQGRAGFHRKRRQGEMLGVGRPEKEEGENRVWGEIQKARQHGPCLRGPLRVKETQLTKAPKTPNSFQSGFHRPAPQAPLLFNLDFSAGYNRKRKISI